MKVTVTWLDGAETVYEADTVTSERVQWKLVRGRRTWLVPRKPVRVLLIEKD